MPSNILFDLIAPLYNHLISDNEKDGRLEPLYLSAEGWRMDPGGGTERASAGLAEQVGHTGIADGAGLVWITAEKRS